MRAVIFFSTVSLAGCGASTFPAVDFTTTRTDGGSVQRVTIINGVDGGIRSRASGSVR